MPRSLVKVYVHFVWATWDRLPLIVPAWEYRLYACLAAKCAELGCDLDTVGGIEDHIHALVRLHPSVAVAQAAKELKGASSHFTSHELAMGKFFKWQGTYGAFSVSESDLDMIRNYIRGQKEHHASGDVKLILERCLDLDPDS